MIGNKPGCVWESDALSEKVVARWKDEGGRPPTTVTKYGGNRRITTGSQSGVANIYDCARSSGGGSDVLGGGTKENPKPVRVFEQLVTAVSVIEFLPDSQVLAVASKGKKDTLRVRLPSPAFLPRFFLCGRPANE